MGKEYNGNSVTVLQVFVFVCVCDVPADSDQFEYSSGPNIYWTRWVVAGNGKGHTIESEWISALKVIFNIIDPPNIIIYKKL